MREMFLRFFEGKGHLRLPSFSLIPENDPSLLLINSGMAPMKPWFTGEQEPPRHRVCTCQKCIRTGDIENIGHTARHGTYFEMLGNFSFGDYFKTEAIHWSWEFLTEVVGLDPNRLYPSIYEDDDEAFEIWNKEMGIPSDRIFRFGKADNFWEHGSGPCGPCSEIYYDRGEKYGCGKPTCTVGCDCDRYVEIWNNVFSQFDNDGEGHYTELKQKNIDTGMGLERLAVAVQDVPSLFDVDTVMNITNRVTELTGASYGQSEKNDVSLRVITDHARASTMMICDGVLPSNEGRGYVLRRLLRRAAQHGKRLGMNQPFLYEVAKTVIRENENHYTELKDRRDYILRVIKTEEENFAKTIDGGMKIFQDTLQDHKQRKETVFSGADAFRLYDTFGFPIDLTVELAEDENMTVNLEEFKQLMQEQKERARKARESLGDLGWSGIEFGKEIPETIFTGYSEEQSEAQILAIVAQEEQRETIGAGTDAIIVLDETPMYAEMGGQIGDHGMIVSGDSVFVVSDVRKNKGGKYMHYGKVRAGSFSVGDPVQACYEKEYRDAIRRAHSATHLLQKALQEVLGDHVEQAGSLVEPDRLRFDFTHFSAISSEELEEIEKKVNKKILEGLPVVTEEMPIEEAKKKGAMALFGEKYGDVVRVVDMGEYSVELCGGTHVSNTAQIGSFLIESESSIASGVRRIEAHVGMANIDDFMNYRRQIGQTASILKTTPHDLVKKAEQTLQELKNNHREIDKLRSELMSGQIDRLMVGTRVVEGLRLLTLTRNDLDKEMMRKMSDELKARDDKVVAVIASVQDEKITFSVCCGKEAIAKGIRAGDLVRQLCQMTGGGGGGRPDSAMGGGKDVLMLDDAIARVDNYITDHIKK